MTPTTIIAITGGSGSGKTTVAKMLQELLGRDNCTIITQDNYYQDQSQHFKGDGSINFDCPQAIDFTLMTEHLEQLIAGQSIQVPIYDFVTHTRTKNTILVKKTNFILVDGTLVLYEEKLRKLFNSSLFLDIPEDIRFARRLKRDVEERGRTPEGVHTQFYTQVKPMHDFYVAPLKIYAHYLAVNEFETKQMIEQLGREYL
ncbi:MAG: uridine kinase [Bdellovibrionota bacterium]